MLSEGMPPLNFLIVVGLFAGGIGMYCPFNPQVFLHLLVGAAVWLMGCGERGGLNPFPSCHRYFLVHGRWD